jgi:curli biogenesis system outer membrane secretion channel CsgG
MKKQLSIVAALALVAGALAPAAAQNASSDVPTLAVLDLEDGGSIGPDADEVRALGPGLATMLATEMMRNPRVRIVERDQIKQLIEEQKLGLSDLTDPSTAVELGRLLGAEYMLFGTYTDVYGTLRVDVRVVNVETGELERAQEVTDKREALFQSVQTLAERLFEDLDLESDERAPAAAPIPARAAIYFSRGLGYEDRGEAEKAAEMFRQALEIHPEYAEAREHLEALGGEA